MKLSQKLHHRTGILAVATLLLAVILISFLYFRNTASKQSTNNTDRPQPSNINPKSIDPSINPVEKTESTDWKWELIGCGSQAPCSYKVCSTSEIAKCYHCMDSTGHSDGLKTEETHINPETTRQFTCQKVS